MCLFPWSHLQNSVDNGPHSTRLLGVNERTHLHLVQSQVCWGAQQMGGDLKVSANEASDWPESLISSFLSLTCKQGDRYSTWDMQMDRGVFLSGRNKKNYRRREQSVFKVLSGLFNSSILKEEKNKKGCCRSWPGLVENSRIHFHLLTFP